MLKIGSDFGINFCALPHKLLRLFLHATLKSFLVLEALFGSVLPHIFCDLHGAEVWTAHAAEMRQLGAFLRQCLVVELASGDRIEAQVELVFPTEFESRFA